MNQPAMMYLKDTEHNNLSDCWIPFKFSSHSCYMTDWKKNYAYITLHHYVSSYWFFPSHRSVMRNGMQQSKLHPRCLFQLSVAPFALPLTPTSSLVAWVALVWSLLSG